MAHPQFAPPSERRVPSSDSAALARFPIAISETNGRDYAFAVPSSDLRGSESIGTYIVLMEAHMPTVDDHLVEAFLARPEIAELLEPAGALIVGILNIVGGMFQMAMAIAHRAEERFPSTAYAQYFKDRGVSPVLAQGMGSLTISLGTMKANESRQLGAVVEAIRFLSEGHRQKRATISRANLLLAAWDDTSIISQIFRKAGLSETEFLSLLKAVVEGGAFERERIKGIAAAVAPSLPSARGRKVSAASAVHEEFLETVGLVASPRAYTWSNVVEDFVDEETKATRREFAAPDFDPRAAYLRFDARRKKAKAG